MIAVAFRISRTGEVRDCKVDRTTLTNAETISCVVGIFEKLRFPVPDAGVVDVVYPIRFEPGGIGNSSAGR